MELRLAAEQMALMLGVTSFGLRLYRLGMY